MYDIEAPFGLSRVCFELSIYVLEFDLMESTKTYITSIHVKPKENEDEIF